MWIINTGDDLLSTRFRMRKSISAEEEASFEDAVHLYSSNYRSSMHFNDLYFITTYLHASQRR